MNKTTHRKTPGLNGLKSQIASGNLNLSQLGKDLVSLSEAGQLDLTAYDKQIRFFLSLPRDKRADFIALRLSQANDDEAVMQRELLRRAAGVKTQ